MSIDLHDRYVLEPDDATLQRRAAGYVIDHLDSEDEVLVVLSMLFAPVKS